MTAALPTCDSLSRELLYIPGERNLMKELLCAEPKPYTLRPEPQVSVKTLAIGCTAGHLDFIAASGNSNLDIPSI